MKAYSIFDDFTPEAARLFADVISFSLCPQSFQASRSFSNESALRIRWPKYWSFSFNISPSNEPRTDLLYDGLVGSPCSPRDSQ